MLSAKYTPQELVSDGPQDTSTRHASVWQKWAKKRVQHVPPLEQVHKISRKVKINVTQIVLEERREQ